MEYIDNVDFVLVKHNYKTDNIKNKVVFIMHKFNNISDYENGVDPISINTYNYNKADIVKVVSFDRGLLNKVKAEEGLTNATIKTF